MDTENQFEHGLEDVFERYEFTPDQRAEAAMDLIQVGESLTFKAVLDILPDEKKDEFKAFFDEELVEEDFKDIYAFIADTITPEKFNEVRSAVYDKLVADYISHMNQ